MTPRARRSPPWASCWVPASCSSTTSALPTGLLQTTTKGHAAQLGGVVIVAPDGSVPYAHLADDAADNPPTDEVLAAARRAATAATRTDT